MIFRIYCELILLFVMSAHSSNDILPKILLQDKSNISNNNTIMCAMATKTLRWITKDCVLEIKESDITEIIQLAKSDRVNIVDLRIISTKTGLLYGNDVELTLANSIGREILSVLNVDDFSHFTWTLNAGRRSFELQVQVSSNGSRKERNSVEIELDDQMLKFVGNSILEQVDLSMHQLSDYAFCFPKRKRIRLPLVCCQITKPSPKLNYPWQCLQDGNLYLHKFRLLKFLWISSFVIRYLSLFFFWCLTCYLVSQSLFDMKYSKYYTLEKNIMSPSSIVLKVIWEERGCVISFIRRSLSMCFLLYLYMNYAKSLPVLRLTITTKAFSLCCGILFPFSCQYRPMKEQYSIPHSASAISDKIGYIAIIALSLGYKVKEFPQKNIATELDFNFFILTLPFNLKYWSTIIKKLHTFATLVCVRMQFRNSTLKYLGLLCTHLLTMLIFFVFLGIFFLCFFFLCCVRYGFFISSIFDIDRRTNQCSCCKLFFTIILFLNMLILIPFLVTNAFEVLSHAILSFLLGLLLNLINFIPYLALSFVLSFYSLNDWKSLEEKYFMLKRLIYEACRDIPSANNGCTPSRRPKKNEKVLPVVSKELYNKIREELLPYQKTIFYYGTKVLCYSLFSCGIFVLVDILQEFNFSAAVQVLTTASISIVPYVFNIIGMTKSEENKALNEKLKLNVKYMVDELTVEDPELARTVLIIQNTYDDMKGDVHEVNNEQGLKENKQFETSV